jgi:hypothetical protein
MYRILGSSAAVATALVLAAPAAAFADTTTDYSINFSKSTVTVQAGDLASNLITFTVVPKLEDRRVRLSVTGLASDITPALFPPIPSLSGSSILSMPTSSSTPAGSYTVTVTAVSLTSTPITHSASFGLTVTGG